MIYPNAGAYCIFMQMHKDVYLKISSYPVANADVARFF